MSATICRWSWSVTIRKCQRFLVDVSGAALVDPAGVAVLVGAWRRVRTHGGRLALAGAPEPVHELFHHGCFADGFALYETVCDALRDGRIGRAVTATLGA
ncbi:STAS domain-containing protein [Actinoallomurus vinaceus]|uniref:STAS domain-containing protein n=1 Tax=Actinoallomurus vinaceus TaxID=1080074 RepID=UPI0031F07B22